MDSSRGVRAQNDTGSIVAGKRRNNSRLEGFCYRDNRRLPGSPHPLAILLFEVYPFALAAKAGTPCHHVHQRSRTRRVEIHVAEVIDAGIAAVLLLAGAAGTD